MLSASLLGAWSGQIVWANRTLNAGEGGEQVERDEGAASPPRNDWGG